jgi:Tol biopolymer transport system component
MKKLIGILSFIWLSACTDSTAPERLIISDNGGSAKTASASVAFVSDRDGSDAIYVANSDGSAVTRLAAGNSPAWSLDGRRIAFVRGVALGGPATIYVMNADGSDLRFLANGSFPSWSPDGSQIVFNGASGGIQDPIFVINADGSGGRKLIGPDELGLPDDQSKEGTLLLPAWSPDGRSIAFVRASFYDAWMIYIMNADGTTPRLFNGASVGDSRLAWSPDGSQLLYQAPGWMMGSAPWTIVSAGANGAGLHSYTPTQGIYAGGPDWSPDARSILFEKFTGPGDEVSAIGSRMRIFVLGLGDGLVRQLIPEAISPVRRNYWDHQAAWSRSAR